MSSLRFSLLLLLLLFLSGCSRPDRAIPEGLETDAAMQEAIRRVVPPETSITEAQARLQGSGFECVHQWHGSWGAEQNLNYLYCHRNEGVWASPRVWQVAIMMVGITVGEVRVTSKHPL